jgi:hypothetical protein
MTHVQRVPSVSRGQLFDPRIIHKACLHIDVTKDISKKLTSVLEPVFVWPVGSTVISDDYEIPASLMHNEEFSSE